MILSIEAAIQAVIDEKVAAAEQRILAKLSGQTDETLDVTQAALHLGISEKLVYRLCQQKQIPHERYGVQGSRRPVIKFRLNDLEAWRAEQRAANYVKAK